MKKSIYRIIKNDEQYNHYCSLLEELSTKGGHQCEDDIELLSLLISKYNSEKTELYRLELNPVELLQDLLSENNISQKELSTRIGVSPQLINDVLKYRREISKSLALKLGNEFAIEFYAFLKPYSLQKAGY